MKHLVKIEEFFSFGKKFEFDQTVKDDFQKLLKNLEQIEVVRFGDHKRRIILSENSENKEKDSKETNYKSETRKLEKVNDFFKGGREIIKNTEREYSPNDTKSGTKIEVIKNTGKSRHWRLFQGGDENFALVRNGQHLIDKDGNSRVNPKIVKIFWELLDKLSELQLTRKKNNISEEDYKSKVDKLRSEYSSKI